MATTLSPAIITTLAIAMTTITMTATHYNKITLTIAMR
jgi:hypothetical protein